MSKRRLAWPRQDPARQPAKNKVAALLKARLDDTTARDLPNPINFETSQPVHTKEEGAEKGQEIFQRFSLSLSSSSSSSYPFYLPLSYHSLGPVSSPKVLTQSNKPEHLQQPTLISAPPAGQIQKKAQSDIHPIQRYFIL